jgi:hypothetical protein
MTLQIACWSALGLGIVSAITMALAFLALTDIYHGEADVTAEWQAVRVAFLVSAAFHVVAVIVALKGVRSTSA